MGDNKTEFSKIQKLTEKNEESREIVKSDLRDLKEKYDKLVTQVEKGSEPVVVGESDQLPIKYVMGPGNIVAFFVAVNKDTVFEEADNVFRFNFDLNDL